MLYGIRSEQKAAKRAAMKTNDTIHGVSDIIGEAGVWVSLSTRSTLLGPLPTGIVGMSMLLIGASILLLKLPNGKLHS